MIDTTRPYRWTLYAGQLASACVRTDNTPRETITLTPVDPKGHTVLGMGPLTITTPHVIPQEVVARLRHNARIVIEFDRTARVASVDGQRFAYPEDIDHGALILAASQVRSMLDRVVVYPEQCEAAEVVKTAFHVLDNVLLAKPEHMAVSSSTIETSHPSAPSLAGVYNDLRDEITNLKKVLYFVGIATHSNLDEATIDEAAANLRGQLRSHASAYSDDINEAIATSKKLRDANKATKERATTKIKHDEEVGRMRHDIGEKQRRENMAQKTIVGMSDALYVIERVLSFNYSDDALEQSIQALPECWRRHARAAVAARRKIDALVTADEAKGNTGNTVAMLVTEATCALGGVHDKNMTANQLALHAIHSLRDRLGAAERFRMTADVVRRGVMPAVKAIRDAWKLADMPGTLGPELDTLENGLALLDAEVK